MGTAQLRAGGRAELTCFFGLLWRRDRAETHGGPAAQGGATQGSARVTWTRRRQPQQCRQHGRAHLQPIPWQEVWRARAEWGGRITRSLRSYKESYKDKSVLRIYPMLLCCGAALQRTSGGRQIKREDSPTKVMDHQTAPSVTPILLRQPQEEAKLSPFSRFFFKSQLLQKF